MRRLLAGPYPILLAWLVLFAALALLISTTRNPAAYGHLYKPLVSLNITGMVLIGMLILYNLVRLVREYRAGALGAKLSVRLLGLFTLIACLPLLAVYVLSVQSFGAQFRNFLDVRVEHALATAANDAATLATARGDVADARIAATVRDAHAVYSRLFKERETIKSAFLLTISLAVAVMFQIAIWAAIYTAHRLSLPLRDLATGTRALAGGDYRGEIPVRHDDDFGALARLFNDMTRRIQRANRDARHSQHVAEVRRAYLATLLGSLSSAVIACDARGRLRTWNAAAADTLGLDLAGYEAQPLDKIVNDRRALEPVVARVLRGVRGGVAWQDELSLPGREGERWMVMRGAPLPGLKRHVGGHVVVFDDVTALRRAMRAATWGEVARRLAHEVKNPLTPIRLSAERIRHKFLPELPEASRPALERLARTIEGQVDTLAALISAFADYARATPPRREPVDLNALAEEAVELFRARLDGVRVTLKLEPAIAPVAADAGRLRQVMNNLIINAQHALVGRTDAAVQVATRSVERAGKSGVEFTVRDNGPGFAPEMIERVFEPYVGTRAEGSGLGLAIVRRIVEEHDGDVAAANSADGGAELRIWLPAMRAAPTIMEAAS